MKIDISRYVRYGIGCFLFAGFCQIAEAQSHTPISLPALFSDHIVLQQQDSVAIWGWGKASSTIKLVGSWAPKDTASAVVDDNGRWIARIKTGKYGGPFTLAVFSGADRIVLNDVLLGEVWLCSGQSNMEWTPANGIVDKENEIADAWYPQMRFFSLPKRGSQNPQDDCQAAWELCTPDVMQKRSAVAYFFGRQLHQQLDIPVGLVVSAWGGTPAEVWLPEETVESTPEIKNEMIHTLYPWWPMQPGVLYNGMIHPLMPYTIAGTIWYQGETNRDNPQSYRLAMEKLIGSWRNGFGKEFPFYLVQIAPYKYNSKNNGPALIREAQEQVVREVARTGLVVTNDVGDLNNIHPARKQQVGIRLANLALGEHYGVQKGEYRSPLLERASVEKNRVMLDFSHAGKGLVCKGESVEGLQIAGRDGQFRKAEARIKGNRLIVFATGVEHPTAVRYCFDDATVGNLYNEAGLPVAPFRKEFVD